ncbi:unnamed protein product [Protopolystoma xenopodis]|uniref:Uncharacterized protein n=1 Tax=Protopolystoma xenopodis TaxID=117903 RepID=A0A3S5BBZ8_9PLAT|nr:unnamed protein product [Protopolystoma xenopodis]
MEGSLNSWQSLIHILSLLPLALGATLMVITEMNKEASIIVSACIALVYTLFGGLYSVAYTDVVQLFCIFIGLWICVPFAMMNENVASLGSNPSRWVGEIQPIDSVYYADNLFMLILGGIPWQVYFQVRINQTSVSADRLFTFNHFCFSQRLSILTFYVSNCRHEFPFYTLEMSCCQWRKIFLCLHELLHDFNIPAIKLEK